MANVKVKVLQTIAGSYGRASAGDSLVLAENDAKSLEKLGLVKIAGESKDEPTVAEKGSVRIADETNEATETRVNTVSGETKEAPKKVATKSATKAAKK